MDTWVKVPLFQKQESKEGLLDLNDKAEVIEKRFDQN